MMTQAAVNCANYLSHQRELLTAYKYNFIFKFIRMIPVHIIRYIRYALLFSVDVPFPLLLFPFLWRFSLRRPLLDTDILLSPKGLSGNPVLLYCVCIPQGPKGPSATGPPWDSHPHTHTHTYTQKKSHRETQMHAHTQNQNTGRGRPTAGRTKKEERKNDENQESKVTEDCRWLVEVHPRKVDPHADPQRQPAQE